MTKTDGNDETPRRRRPPLFVRMADEGNVPGRPSTKAVLYTLLILIIGVIAISVAGSWTAPA